MKFAFTLLLILFTTLLKLSASANYLDTAKTIEASNEPVNSKSSALIIHQDSLSVYGLSKHSEGLKVYVSINNTYSVKLAAVNNTSYIVNPKKHTDDLKITDSLKSILAISHADSTKIAISLKKSDSLKLVEAVHVDSMKQQLKLMDLNALILQLKVNKYEALKGPMYFEIAARYMNYDTISNKTQRLYWQNEALSYTMKALHQYSMYNDTTGLRSSFDNLARVYFAQRKIPQAKWFILQSNTLSRAKNDVPNIIASLLTLAAIKCEINDNTLAMRDLNEALQLSINNHLQKTELDVLKNFAFLYSRLKNYPKEELVLKKRDSLQESIRKEEEAKLVAAVNIKTLVQKKKQDSLQSKKKVYTSNIRKPYKSNSSKKTDLL